MPTDPKTWDKSAVVGHIQNLIAYLDELEDAVIMNNEDYSETFALLAQAKLAMIVEAVSK
jgi:hypothetical protein